MKKKKLISLVLAGTMVFVLAFPSDFLQHVDPMMETRNLKEIQTVIR